MGNFEWFYMTLADIYILIAILMIKTDFINTQRELIRIQLEQKNIYNEMPKEQEERQQEEQKDKNKENEEKEKKDNKQEDGLDEQTQE